MSLRSQERRKKNKKDLAVVYLFCGFLKWSGVLSRNDATQTKTVHTAQILKICFQEICIFHFLFFLHHLAETRTLKLLTSGKRVLPKLSYHIRGVGCDKI